MTRPADPHPPLARTVTPPAAAHPTVTPPAAAYPTVTHSSAAPLTATPLTVTRQPGTRSTVTPPSPGLPGPAAPARVRSRDMAEALRTRRTPPPAHPLELLWVLTKEAPMTERGPGVLVLCTGNSARSQMAEAFLRRHGGGRFPVYSAGTEPAAAIHPLTVEVMGERGIDLADRRPEHVDRYLGTPVHTVILVCDGATKSCPALWPGAQRRLLWPFEDPAAFEGSEEERRAKFREIRDAIEERVVGWLEEAGMAVAAASETPSA